MQLKNYAHRLLILVILGALSLGGFFTWNLIAMVPGQARVLLVPQQITVIPAAGLPPEVKQEEINKVPLAFDQDTTTEYTAYGTSRIEVSFAKEQLLEEVKFFNSQPYLASFYYWSGTAWVAIPNLTGVNLAGLNAGWNGLALSTSLKTSKIRIDVSPQGAGATTGVTEIEFWGKGEVQNDQKLNDLQQLFAANTPHPSAEEITISDLQQIDGAGKTLTFHLTQNPAYIKQAWLIYESYGVSHWISAARSINGNPIVGGDFVLSDTKWTQQAEEINPDWLLPGDNQIHFTLPLGQEKGYYQLKNTKLLVLYRDGYNHIKSTISNAEAPSSKSANTLDGNAFTSWQPFAVALGNVKPEVVYVLENPIQLERIALYIQGTIKGTLRLDYWVGGKWVNFGGSQNLSKMVNGWNEIQVSPGVVEQVRLTVENGSGTGGFAEVALLGSHVGKKRGQGIQLTYPLGGEYFNDRAYLRGFLTQPNNGSGPAAITIGGQSITSPDGAFGVVVTRESVGATSLGNWFVPIKAVYPNGEFIETLVELKSDLGGQGFAMDLPQVGSKTSNSLNKNPGAVAAMGNRTSGEYHNVDEAELELEFGAKTNDEKITITPLQSAEVPQLDEGMVNVTKGPRRGYRFGPHGSKFRKHIKVSLPYDTALLPQGMTEEDIQTFYFDEVQGRWIALERINVDKKQKKIVSRTTHFTDMINATLALPESPQTEAFNPTQIKDIKAANPAAGIQVMQAPQPSNQGDNNLQYPLQLPPGRAGIQPQLAISYSSAGGGLFGQGWDLSIPSISVDTKFGVPRYDINKETETYLFEGSALTPMAHRSQFQTRQLGVDKVFTPRVNKNFTQVVRKGAAPAQYWFLVTEKNGTKYYYGGIGSKDAKYVVQQGHKISKWLLAKMEDVQGNSILYEYKRRTPVNEVELEPVISKITYTGFQSQSGAYTVEFFSDHARNDIRISANVGYAVKSDTKINRIDIKWNGSLIRRYEAQYTTGPFEKTLLTKIIQKSSSGAVISQHGFEYFNEIKDNNGNYQGFASEVVWNTENDSGIKSHFKTLKNQDPTLLGTSFSTSKGVSGYTGFNPFMPVKSNSAGYSVNSGSGETNSYLSFMDIDGDNLPDKVFLEDKFYYRKNLGNGTFSQKINLQGFRGFSQTKTRNSSKGGQFFYGPANYLDSVSQSISTTKRYFSDVNGDGLIDIVDGGRTFFNRLENGIPTFHYLSSGTPVPLAPSTNQLNGTIDQASFDELYDEELKNNPLVDAIKRWKVPFSGKIQITGTARLKQDTSAQRSEYTTADGVILYIQHKGTKLYEQKITANDYNAKSASVSSFPVSKGDYLYFRVHSIFDGKYDDVEWSPNIQYLEVDNPNEVDANGLGVYRFNAATDYTSMNTQGYLAVPFNGTIKFKATLEKSAPLSDSVHIYVYHKKSTDPEDSRGTGHYIDSIEPNRTGVIELQWPKSLQVEQSDQLEVVLGMDSQVDLNIIKFKPELYYSAISPGQEVNSTGTVTLDPLFRTEIYSASSLSTPNEPAEILQADLYFVAPNFHGKYEKNGNFSKLSIDNRVTMTIKSQGRLKSKSSIDLKPTKELKSDNVILNYFERVPVDRIANVEQFYLNQGEKLYFEFFSRDMRLLLATSGASYKLIQRGNQTWKALKNGPVKIITPHLAGHIDIEDQTDNKVKFFITNGEEVLYKSLIPGNTQSAPITLNFAKGQVIHFDSVYDYESLNPLTLYYAPKQGVVLPLNSKVQIEPIVTFDSALDTRYSENHIIGFASTQGGGTGDCVMSASKTMASYKGINSDDPPDKTCRLRLDGTKGSLVPLYLIFPYQYAEHLTNHEFSLTYWSDKANRDFGHGFEWSDVHEKGEIKHYQLQLNFEKTPQANGTIRFDIIGAKDPISQIYQIVNGQIQGAAPTQFDVILDGHNLDFVLETNNLQLLQSLQEGWGVTEVGNPVPLLTQLKTKASITFEDLGFQLETVPVSNHEILSGTTSVGINRIQLPGMFGPGYRGWEYVAYKPAASNNLAVVNETEFNKDYSEYQNNHEEFANVAINAYGAYPSAEANLATHKWIEGDENWGISASVISSSRKGEDYIERITPEVLFGQGETYTSFGAGASAPMKVVSVKQNSKTYGLAFVSYSKVRDSDTTVSKGAEFMDLNGDRFPDLLTEDGSNKVKIQYTYPDGSREVARPVDFVRMDKTKDESEMVSAGAAIPAPMLAVQKNDQSSDKTQPGFLPSGAFSFSTNEAEFSFGDLNGDGLIDMISISGGLIMGRLNQGYSFGPLVEWGQGQISYSKSINTTANLGFSADHDGWSAGVSASTGQGYSQYSLQDINGDGLADLLSWNVDLSPSNFDSASGDLVVRFNMGDHFGESVVWKRNIQKPLGSNKSTNRGVSGTFPITFPACIVACWVYINPGVNGSESINSTMTMMQDVNGDGLPDLTRSNGNAQLNVQINKVGKTNLLKKVQLPMGAIMEFDYQRSPNTYENANSKWLLTKVLTHKGTDTKAMGGADFLLSSFEYLDGYHDRYEREFYGFAKVVENTHNTNGRNLAEIQTTLPLLRKVERTFLNDHYYSKGLLVSERLFSGGGSLFSETIQHYNYLRSENIAVSVTEPATYQGSVFPALVRTDKKFYEGGQSPVQTYTAMEYGPYGNVTRFIDGGNLQNQSDDVQAEISYASCPSAYIMGVPQSIAVVANGQELRKRTATINCATGKMTHLMRHYDGKVELTELTYDNYGNLSSVTGPANNKGERYRLDYTYDSTLHQYPVLVADSFGLSSSSTYNYAFGQVLTSTDTNGHKITYTYDDWGRQTSVTGPYEQAGGVQTIQFEYHPEAPVPYAITRHYDAAGILKGTGTIDTVLFINPQGQIIQTKKEISLYQAGDTSANAFTVSGRVVYDALGQAIQQYDPRTQDLGGAATFLAIPSNKVTTTTYDVMGRPTKKVLPDGATTQMQYSANGESMITLVIDAENKEKKTYRDARGLITKVAEKLESRWLETTYSYDPLKQITLVRDAGGNQTRVEYDQLGRRTLIDNPDQGPVRMRYDGASNLIEKITANHAAAGTAGIQYEYQYNRLIKTLYPNNPEDNVTYEYGAPKAQFNRAGRLWRVTHGSGVVERKYGKLGEVIEEKKSLAEHFPTAKATEIQQFTTAYQFDTFGRLLLLTLPDGEVVTHEYDAGGNVTKIWGQKQNVIYKYLNNMLYDEQEQRVFVEYGNGVKSHYTYDDNQRLTHLETANSRRKIQVFNYDYDQVGNVVRLSNDLAVPMDGYKFGGPATQTFEYDDLHRLVAAKGQYVRDNQEEHSYRLRMKYSDIHNIQQKTQFHEMGPVGSTKYMQPKTSYDWAYQYEGSQPHAPSRIGQREFRYDANGNQLGWSHAQSAQRRDILWDDENRVQQIADNGMTTRFRYDDSGERTFKIGKQGSTVYVNQFFVVRNGSIVSKHFFAGKSRVATQLFGGLSNLNNFKRQVKSTGDYQPLDAAQMQGQGKGSQPQAPQDPSLTQPDAPTKGNGQEKSNQGQGNGNDNGNGNGNGNGNPNSNGNGNQNATGSANSNAGGNGKGKGNAGGNSNAAPADPTLPGNSNAGNGNANPGNQGNGNTGDKGNQGQQNKAEKFAEGHPGQGLLHRSDRANEVAQNTVKNPWLAAEAEQGGGTTTGPATGGSAIQKQQPGKAEHKLYFYHPDHLGSTGYVTDEFGAVYQHLQYFPFGETWTEEASNTDRIPYLFTGKELDEETGLYYFGARYYDPRASLWVSVDPILGDYLPSAKEWAGDTKKNDQNEMAQWLPEPYQWNPQTLRGMGGVYTPTNLNLYLYVGNNPVRYIDPDGKAWRENFLGTVAKGDPSPYGRKGSDAVDELARKHDIAYDKFGADGVTDAIFNVDTHGVDLRLGVTSLAVLFSGETKSLSEGGWAFGMGAVFTGIGAAKLPFGMIKVIGTDLGLFDKPEPNQRYKDEIFKELGGESPW